MKLIGLLCWFDERPSWLAGVIGGLHRAQVTELVAVDGAYSLYPGGRPYSGPEQHATIVETCRALDIGCTIHTPREPFIGNEVEKRNLAFRLAETIAEPGDWYFLVDADHFIIAAGGHLSVLAATDCDAGAVRFTEPYGAIQSAGPLRCLFRAIRGLQFDGNHYTYRTPDGRDLHHMLEPAVDLSMIEVEHRTGERDRYRKGLQQDYYRRRDETGAETHPPEYLVTVDPADPSLAVPHFDAA